MHANELAALLASHSLFADCDNDELSDIILRGHFVRYRKGQELMGQGDDGDNLLIILTGFARVSMVASNGHEIVLDYAEPGYVIGEIAFLDGGPRTLDRGADRADGAVAVAASLRGDCRAARGHAATDAEGDGQAAASGQ